MASEETKAISYNDNNYRALMAEFKTLSAFAEVAVWDERARAEVERIIKVAHVQKKCKGYRGSAMIAPWISQSLTSSMRTSARPGC